MPELPEVQTTVNGINHFAEGSTITDVWSDYDSPHYVGKNQIKDRKFFATFRKEIIGSKITQAERRAKNVLIHLSNGMTILIHMKMTGHLLYGRYELQKEKRNRQKEMGSAKKTWVALDPGPLQDPFNQFIHLVFTVEKNNTEKHLAFSDMRKFAKVTLIDTENLTHSPDLAHIGPEPLAETFTAKDLSARFSKKPNGKIKTVLMDQTVVAGIGNIYSDEILWASDIHPLTLVKHLSPKNISLIWKHTKNILRKGIDFGGDSMSDYRNLDGEAGKFQLQHEAYRRTGKPCRKKSCAGTIARLKIGGRSAHFCPVHQKICV
jgi:formamidopyrimidine-DNA glycosylase